MARLAAARGRRRPREVQIMYGVGGRAAPHRVRARLAARATRARGRCASATPPHEQFQLDVYGEVMDALHQARAHGLARRRRSLALQRKLMDFLEGALGPARRGDLGGARAAPPLHALQGDGVGRVRPRGARPSSASASTGPVERWRAVRAGDPRRGLREGFDAELGLVHPVLRLRRARRVDAPDPAARLPARRRPARGRHRRRDPARPDARRLRPALPTRDENAIDGLPGGEGAFLPCSFWLVDALLLLGRDEEARALFERLLGAPTTSACSSEEYDPRGSACSATSRRRSPTSVSSTPRTTSRRTQARRPQWPSPASTH